MQSVRAGAVQTHFFIFTLFLKNSSYMTSFGVNFGGNFDQKMQFWVKKGLQKMDQKKGARPYAHKGLERTMTMARGSLTAPLACALFWTRNNYLSKKQEQLLISESISEPFSWNGLFFDFMSEEMFIFWWNLKQKRQVVANVFLLLFLSKGLWSDTLWAKARRILFVHILEGTWWR